VQWQDSEISGVMNDYYVQVSVLTNTISATDTQSNF